MKKKSYYILLLVVIVAATTGVPSPTHANPDTFGKTDIGSRIAGLGPNYISGSKFALTETGTVTKMGVYIGSSCYGSGNSKCAIYDVGGDGEPSNLKVESAESTSLTLNAWNNFSVSPGVELSAGDYWLLFWSQQNPELRYDTGGWNVGLRSFRTYGVWPDPWTADTTTYCNHLHSIYATCTIEENPTYSNVGTNTTLAGQLCLFYTQWSDDVGLSGFVFGTNNTGVWSNDTWTDPWTGTPLSGWSNVTKTLNSSSGTRIEYRFWCNDTNNNWAETGIRYIITAPTATIRGTVTDFQTGGPIEGVNVTCYGQSTLTALDGTYSFTVSPGPEAPDIRPYFDIIDFPDVFSLSSINALPTTNSCSIAWTTDLPATSKVEYSTSPLFNASFVYDDRVDFHYWDIDHVPGTVVEDATVVTNHSITLTGLSPGTLYYFRVQSEGSGGIATSKVYTFTMSLEVLPWTIEISSNPSEGGTTSPLGTVEVPVNQSLTVTATANASYAFDHWESDITEVNGSTDNPVKVPAQAEATAHTLVAVFSAVPTYTLTITATVGGTTDPSVGNYSYVEGTTAMVTAYPDSECRFDYWELDLTPHAENPTTVLMDTNHTLHAVFEEIPTEEQSTVQGVVKDNVGNPIEAATVIVNGYSTSTTSDGLYSLTMPAAAYTLTVSKTGYQTHLEPIDVSTPSTYTRNVTLVIPSEAAYKSEVRFAWVAPESLNNPNWDLIAQTSKDYGIDVIIVKIMAPMWANYLSEYIPHAPEDQLAPAIAAAHARGMELHFSMSVLLGAYKDEHKVVDADGHKHDWTCPTNPLSRAHLKNLVEEVVSNYAVDGFMFDYIRYDTANVCYCEHCKAKFEEYLGENITEWPGDFAPEGLRYQEFMEWRVHTIDELVKDMRDWMLAIRPDLTFSAAVFGWVPGWPCYNRYWIGQDFVAWIKEGCLDFVAPMMYDSSLDRIEGWVQDYLEYGVGGPEGKTPLVCFLTHLHPDVIPPEDFKIQVDTVRSLGADGWSTFRYGGPGDGERFYTLTFSKAGYFNETRSQVCPTEGEYIVDVSMKPLTATMRGSVTDSKTGNPIESVNVTCDGASTLTALDGTYSLTVTLGSYTLTFTKSGYVTETRTQDCPAVGEYVVNVALEPLTATITGTVTDNETGVPIEAVRVTANGLETFTNSSGVYVLVVRLGAYNLTFEKSGYYTNTTTVDCPTEGTYPVDVSLVPVPPQPPVNYELVIEDMDEGNKLYAMHKFYHFTAKAYDNDGDISMIKIAFTDGVTWANFSFTLSHRTFIRLSGYLITELNVSDCSYEIGGEWVNATFSIRIKYGVDDAPGIELYQLSEDSSGNKTGWQTMQTDYANIIKPNVSAPSFGSTAASMTMVGTVAGAVALWILWKKHRKKEQIQDDTHRHSQLN